MLGASGVVRGYGWGGLRPPAACGYVAGRRTLSGGVCAGGVASARRRAFLGSARRRDARAPAPRAAGTGPGGGVLDKPTTSPNKGRESEFDVGKVRRTKEPPQFRVILHNDDFNRREYVVQVLLKCIPGMTVDIAVNIMNEAHNHGMAAVITCGQDDAESYCESLRANGLVSSIEPAGGGGGSDVPGQ